MKASSKATPFKRFAMFLNRITAIFLIGFYSVQPCYADPLTDAWNRIQEQVRLAIVKYYKPSAAPAIVDNIVRDEILRTLQTDIRALSLEARVSLRDVVLRLRDICEQDTKFPELSIKLKALAHNLEFWPNRQLDLAKITDGPPVHESPDLFQELGLRMNDQSLRERAIAAFRMTLSEELGSMGGADQARLLTLIGRESGFGRMILPESVEGPLRNQNELSNYYSGMISVAIEELANRLETIEGVAAMTTYLGHSMTERLSEGPPRTFSSTAADHLRAVKDKGLLSRGLTMGVQIVTSEVPDAASKTAQIAWAIQLPARAPDRREEALPAASQTKTRLSRTELAMQSWQSANLDRRPPRYLRIPGVRQICLAALGHLKFWLPK